MCGRFMLISPAETICADFGISTELAAQPRFNIAPTQEIIGVVKILGEESIRIMNFRWGLIPYWSRDSSIGTKLINARCETITEKPAFRKSFRTRRTLIPANGFYEWDKKTRPRTPYLIGLENGQLFAMAGIWDEWTDTEKSRLITCSIVTTASNELVNSIHDRMPVLIKPEHYEAWLGETAMSPELASEIFKPYPASMMTMKAVSHKLNRAGCEGPECLTDPEPGLFGDTLTR